MHVALVAPFHEVAPLQVGLPVGLVDRVVIGIPDLGLLRGDSRGMDEFHVERIDGLLEAHVLIADRKSPVLVIVEQRRRLGIDAALVPTEVREVRGPLAVRGLLLAHQHEGLALVAGLDPVHRSIGGDVRHVAGGLDNPLRRLHRWIVVDALALQDLPVVKPLRVAVEVPLSDEGGLVAGGAEQLRESRLGAVEDGVGVVIETVQVGILAGQDDGTARTADRVRDEGPVEAHALLGDAVDVGRLDQLAGIPVRADGLISMVIGIDEDDVRLLGGRGGQQSNRAEQEQAETGEHSS